MFTLSAFTVELFKIYFFMSSFTVFIFSLIGLLSSVKELVNTFVPTGKSIKSFVCKLPCSTEASKGFVQSHKLLSDTIRAVPTFQNISLYWKPADGSSTREALVRYRIKGTDKWLQAQSLWFDDRVADSIGGNTERSKEYRGSIVNLHSGTVYEIEVSLSSVNKIARTTVATMNENFPISKTVMLPVSSGSSLEITEGGTA